MLLCRQVSGRFQVGYGVVWGFELQMTDRLQANHSHFNCNLGLRVFTGVFTGI